MFLNNLILVPSTGILTVFEGHFVSIFATVQLYSYNNHTFMPQQVTPGTS